MMIACVPCECEEWGGGHRIPVEMQKQPYRVCSRLLNLLHMSSKDGTLVAKLAHQVLLSMKPSLPDQSLFLKQVFWNWGHSSEVEHLISKYKALSLVLSQKQNTKQQQKPKATKTSLKRFLHFTCAILKLAIMKCICTPVPSASHFSRNVAEQVLQDSFSKF